MHGLKQSKQGRGGRRRNACFHVLSVSGQRIKESGKGEEGEKVAPAVSDCDLAVVQ